jgi:hypothetical protein
MARPWLARPPREGGPRGIRAPALVLALALVWPLLGPVSDVAVYRHYAAGFPHLLPVEYPALAGVVFALPKILPLPYTVGFVALMAAAFVGSIRLARRSPGLPAGWSDRFVGYVALGLVGVVATRFDLLPALALLVAVERARAGRWSAAWVWALIGALLKVFPILLLPGFLLAERRSTGRVPWARVGATAGGLGALAAVQSWGAPGTLLRPLSYELHRGFEFSSVPGTLTLLFSPAHLHFALAYGNHQVYGAGHALIASLMLAAAAGGLVTIWVLAARGAMPIEAVALAVVSVAVLSDKALAPQYLLWLAPLWAYWRPRRSWLVASALTALVFPILYLVAYYDTGSLYAGAVAAGVRNVVLLVGTAAWAVEGLRTRWAERATCPAVVPDATEVVPCLIV